MKPVGAPSIPQATREAVRGRSRGFCEECGRRGPLEFHHRYYNVDGEPDGYDYATPIFGKETPGDLEHLCRDCHHSSHIGPDGTFHADPQECAAEWDAYMHATENSD